MFQTFEVTARPEQGPPRLAALREEMAGAGLDGFLVPRADAHQGEYVAARDARLAWLTGFTGSAGFCVALRDIAGVFIDGRYRTQVKDQVADVYTPVPWPDVRMGDWLKDQLPQGGKVGFDPWLHAVAQLREARRSLDGTGIELIAHDNLVDRIWPDQPAPPAEPARAHPLDFAGETARAKRERLGRELAAAGHRGAVLTLPDSIMWLLNIRGSDIERNPVAQCFAILYDTGAVDLFITPSKVADLADHLGGDVTVWPTATLIDALEALDGPIRYDPGSAPQAVADALGERGTEGPDPCLLPKACKNEAEIAGSAAAHLRDGAAMVECLAWLDAQAPGTITEIDVVRRLEACRRQDNALQDISFETISGTGPNGAIMHYRVTEETDATLQDGHLLVLDSGGQYLDGTTDITRTIAVGEIGHEERAAFTRVLQGMIAMSRLRWPRGHSGREIEAVGRMPLWLAGQDFNHGLGHGVGAYLSVHEGPQRLSRTSDVALQPGMILSNEPGYYREGAFGIRIENLLVVQAATPPEGADPEREMYDWRTLTFVPIDRRCILADMLAVEERAWLDAYHSQVWDKIAPRVGDDARAWLKQACAPL
ncbi:aminopeptidase P family protein [Marinibacterium sp. SX1]|uniref:aminopeptidase P family protein n=1 Tax=Marinibacterium sp. SX1 TaxID=3388424 RepID=UPI003D16E526